MAILNFPKKPGGASAIPLLERASLEVMPRTAAKIPDFRALLPAGSRIYVAHIDGTPFEGMVATAKRLADEGFTAMPHLPARLIQDRVQLDDWLARYAGEAGATQALVIAGGPKQPRGTFDSSMQLLETGLFDKHGFTRLHVAGHPEGNRDIDPDGSTRIAENAVRWKAAFADRTGAEMALVTQFAFDADPVLDWARRLEQAGVALPIHVGVAGPAKLQTLIRFGLACGVGPSVKVLERRARDLTKLVRPFEPQDVLSDLAAAHAAGRAGRIEAVHFFPLGGIMATTDYLQRLSGAGENGRTTLQRR